MGKSRSRRRAKAKRQRQQDETVGRERFAALARAVLPPEKAADVVDAIRRREPARDLGPTRDLLEKMDSR